jgi:hypothetical protein
LSRTPDAVFDERAVRLLRLDALTGDPILPPPPDPPISGNIYGLPNNVLDGFREGLRALANADFVKELAAVAALAVPLLPAIGCIARAIELILIDVNPQLAATSPLGSLALTGAGVLLAPAYNFLFASIIYVPTFLALAAWVSKRTGSPWVWRGLVLVGVLAWSLFAPDWPAGWVLALPTAFVWLSAWRILRPGVSFSAVITMIFVGAAIAAMAAAYTGRVPGIVEVRATIASGAPIPTANYVLLGEDQATVILQRCGAGNGPAIILSRTYVVALEESPDRANSGPSLWSVLFRAAAPAPFVHKPC